MTVPMVVVETGPVGVEDARGELLSRGWSEVVECQVTDEHSAALAVLAAIAGRPLLVDGRGPRDVMDRLCDDLRRLGHLDHRVELNCPLSSDQHDLLRLLADGATLGTAAEAVHLSRRSADRRLAAARVALGAESTGGAVAAYQRRLSRLPVPRPRTSP